MQSGDLVHYKYFMGLQNGHPCYIHSRGIVVRPPHPQGEWVVVWLEQGGTTTVSREHLEVLSEVR